METGNGAYPLRRLTNVQIGSAMRKSKRKMDKDVPLIRPLKKRPSEARPGLNAKRRVSIIDNLKNRNTMRRKTVLGGKNIKAALLAAGGAGASRNAQNSRLPILKRDQQAGLRRGSRLSIISRKTLNARKSSIVGIYQSESNPDPRPIHDPAYLSKISAETLDFLAENGYERSLAQAFLRQPSNRSYSDVFLFLVRLFDPNFKYSNKHQNDIAGVFKFLTYPAMLSKTWLSSVGSKNTWPKLLAAMHWLIELLMYYQKSESGQTTRFILSDGDDIEEESDDENDESYFQFVSHSYFFFMNGKEEERLALDYDMEEKFRKECQELDEKTKSILAEEEEIRKEIEQLKLQPSPLQAVESEISELLAEKERLEREIEDFKKNEIQLAEVIKIREQELAKVIDDNSKLEEELVAVKEIVSNQKISKVEYKRLKSEIKELTEQISEYHNKNANLDDEIWALEKEIKQFDETVRTNVNEYRRIVSAMELENEDSLQIELGVLDIDEKFSHFKNAEGIDKDSEEGETLLSVLSQSTFYLDLACIPDSSYAKVREFIKKSKEDLEREVEKIKKDISNLKLSIVEIQSDEKAIIAEIGSSQQRLKEDEAKYEKLVETYRDRRSERSEKIKKLKKRISKLQQELEDEKEREEVKKKIDALQNREKKIKMENSRFNQEILDILTKITEFKTEVKDGLEKLYSTLEERG